MNHLHRGISIAGLFACALSSCNKFDKDEPIPAYLFVDSVNLSTYYIDEGSNSHAISDVWVYLNSGDKITQIGVFELPARIPVIAQGTYETIFYAGIKPDGISSKRKRYPFYKPLTLNINYSPLQEVKLNGTQTPVFTYYDQNQIAIWKEDFEDPTVFFEADPTSEASFVRILAANEPDNVYEGIAAGLLELSNNQTYLRVYTNQNFNLPGAGKSCYVEINYKCNQEFKVGLKVENQSGNQFLGNTAIKDTYNENGNLVWKKMYIDLTDIVSTNPSANSYEFYFEAVNAGAINTRIYLDNVKLVYAR